MTTGTAPMPAQVQPGDVLLLRGAGWTALANRTGQRAMRALRPLQTARYTHVALVVSATHLADAMPGAGVRIRSWREAAGSYQLTACRLARHPGLAGLADDPQPLLDRVQYYYAQRYWLTALARRHAQHGAGIVCSQFVALVLQDLGLRPLVSTPMRALPSDIDHGTRGRHGWRQWPLPGLAWAAAAADAPDAWPEHVGFAVSEAVGRMTDLSMASAEAALRKTAEFDRFMLEVAATLHRAREAGQEAQALPLVQALHVALAAASPGSTVQADVSGASLLLQWQAHHVDAAGRTPQVLADADAPERRAAHRALLARSVAELTRLAQERNAQALAFRQAVDKVFDLGVQGRPVGTDLVAQLHRWGCLLLQDTGWLEAEAADAILARTASYPALIQCTLTPLLPRLGASGAEQALDQLRALAGLDEQRLRWVVESRPVLVLQTDTLASLLPPQDGPA